MKITSAAFAGLLLVAGCAAGDAVPSRGNAPAAADVPGVRDGQVRLTVGQALTISLPSNATTGYQWRATGMEDGVLTPDAPFGQEITDAHAPGMVGVGGVTHWRFVAARPGSTTLTFNYSRSWERDTRPAETAIYRVVVR